MRLFSSYRRRGSKAARNYPLILLAVLAFRTQFCFQDVREQHKFSKGRQRILPGEHRFSLRSSNRLNVGTQGQVTSEHLGQRGRHIRQQPHPTHAGSTPARFHRVTQLVCKQ